jgi:transposase-like protein
MPQKSKITSEEKVKIVESYLSGKIGYTSAYETAGVCESSFRRWINRYKTEGPAEFLSTKPNKHYAKEIKQSAVVDYLDGKGSLQDICNKYRIRHIQILANWIKAYNSHEEFRIMTGGSRMTKSRNTTLEERIEIAMTCIKSSNNYGETALKYRVSYQQVYGWVKKYRAMGEAGLEDRRGRRSGSLPSRTPEEELRDRIAQLEREKLDLEMENALLKKVKELERRRR